jgi:hypothetical protein
VSLKRFVCILLLITLTAVFVKPARADAMDPNVILIIVGAGIAVVGVIAIIIIANASEGRRRSAELSIAQGGSPVVVFHTTAVESP